MKNISKEDYLRIIYELSQKREGGGVRSVEVANNLMITKASASAMIRKLAGEGYVSFEPYSALTLTGKGIECGKKILRKHLIIEAFLKNVLGYRENEAHEQAHDLEHAFNDESIKRLEQFLKKSNFL